MLALLLVMIGHYRDAHVADVNGHGAGRIGEHGIRKDFVLVHRSLRGDLLDRARVPQAGTTRHI